MLASMNRHSASPPARAGFPEAGMASLMEGGVGEVGWVCTAATLVAGPGRRVGLQSQRILAEWSP